MLKPLILSLTASATAAPMPSTIQNQLQSRIVASQPASAPPMIMDNSVPVPPLRKAHFRGSITKVTLTKQSDGTYQHDFQRICSGEGVVDVLDGRSRNLQLPLNNSILECDSTLNGQNIKVHAGAVFVVYSGQLFPADPVADIKTDLSWLFVNAPGGLTPMMAFNNYHATRSQGPTSDIEVISVDNKWVCTSNGSSSTPTCEPALTEYFTATVELTDTP